MLVYYWEVVGKFCFLRFVCNIIYNIMFNICMYICVGGGKGVYFFLYIYIEKLRNLKILN